MSVEVLPKSKPSCTLIGYIQSDAMPQIRCKAHESVIGLARLVHHLL